jgi:methylenetetrahydrofolate dehydrogenase (NADP+)/methenyltetrahydrofolate cyclohydrolase
MITNSKIIDGKLHAHNFLKKLKPLSAKYFEKFARKPSLAVILLGNNPASQIYVKNKIKVARDNDIESKEILFSNDVSENKLLDKIIELNKNNNIDGILVQLPLPKHISEKNNN